MSRIPGFRPGELLIGISPAIRRVCDQLRKASLTDVPVLITGESGTGKGVAAKLLHDMSARSGNTFLNLSCAAMSSQLFDCEPFGHSLGANLDRSSFGGTLFLDEIGELDLALQGKLLRELQDLHLMGSGAGSDSAINIRLICATNRDLESEIAGGIFRADLYYRINVLRIQMPPLRECIADVPILMSYFIRLYSRKFGKDPVSLNPSLVKALELYQWPGNTRELENMAKRYVVLGGEEHVLSMMRSKEQPIEPEAVDLTTPLRVQTKRAVQDLESKIILSVLKAHNWNRRKTARSLDISYRTLLYKIKRAAYRGRAKLPDLILADQKISGPRRESEDYSFGI